MGAAKQKTFGQKLQRKYFSEITADEMEKLVRKFESDFLIFGYTFEQYKKALKSHWQWKHRTFGILAGGNKCYRQFSTTKYTNSATLINKK